MSSSKKLPKDKDRQQTLKTISPKYVEVPPVIKTSPVKTRLTDDARMEQVTSFMTHQTDPPQILSMNLSRQEASHHEYQSVQMQRQSSYQRMLQKYNEKKDKLGSQRQNLQSATAADPPPKPSLLGRLSSQRGNSGERSQPQYIAYLEKTLDKSEQASQQLRQVSGKLSVLESKVEALQVGYNLDYVVQKIKGLEEMQIHQVEENNLNKILVQTLQNKIKEQDIVIESMAQHINAHKLEAFNAAQINQVIQDNASNI